MSKRDRLIDEILWGIASAIAMRNSDYPKDGQKALTHLYRLLDKLEDQK